MAAHRNNGVLMAIALTRTRYGARCNDRDSIIIRLWPWPFITARHDPVHEKPLQPWEWQGTQWEVGWIVGRDELRRPVLSKYTLGVLRDDMCDYNERQNLKPKARMVDWCKTTAST